MYSGWSLSSWLLIFCAIASRGRRMSAAPMCSVPVVSFGMKSGRLSSAAPERLAGVLPAMMIDCSLRLPALQRDLVTRERFQSRGNRFPLDHSFLEYRPYLLWKQDHL